MKSIMIIAIFLLITGLSGVNAQEDIKKQAAINKSDSVTYELLIIDAGFEAWLATQVSSDFRSKEYYRNWNIRYVNEWNSRYLNEAARYPQIESYIDYDISVDYGLELNYRLYMYFQFFEKKNKITLIRRK